MPGPSLASVRVERDVMPTSGRGTIEELHAFGRPGSLVVDVSSGVPVAPNEKPSAGCELPISCKGDVVPPRFADGTPGYRDPVEAWVPPFGCQLRRSVH